jgi:multisubunit Na+/H+ antiporter MnhE subunit
VLVWLMAPLTWLVVEAQSDRATSAAYWIVGLVVGLVLLVLTAAWYPTQADGRG